MKEIDSRTNKSCFLTVSCGPKIGQLYNLDTSMSVKNSLINFSHAENFESFECVWGETTSYSKQIDVIKRLASIERNLDLWLLSDSNQWMLYTLFFVISKKIFLFHMKYAPSISIKKKDFSLLLEKSQSIMESKFIEELTFIFTVTVSFLSCKRNRFSIFFVGMT